MSKMQQIWDSFHPVKVGQTVPKGTEYVTSYHTDRGLISLTLDIVGEDITVRPSDVDDMRTIEPLPDPDDTGNAVFSMAFDDCVDIGDIEVTRQQARNFARKLLEELDE